MLVHVASSPAKSFASKLIPSFLAIRSTRANHNPQVILLVFVFVCSVRILSSAGSCTTFFVTGWIMRNRLTVIIPCKNEVQNLWACIESVRSVADELIVADSGSTDETVAIARAAGGWRVIEREWKTACDFKNWAVRQASHDWILIVDADERVTPELAAEIRQVLADPSHSGYEIKRANYFMGHCVRYGQWGADKVLRLFDRTQAAYAGDTDHATVRVLRGRAGSSESIVAPIVLDVRPLSAKTSPLREAASRAVASDRQATEPDPYVFDCSDAILSDIFFEIRIPRRFCRFPNQRDDCLLFIPETGTAVGTDSRPPTAVFQRRHRRPRSHSAFNSAPRRPN